MSVGADTRKVTMSEIKSKLLRPALTSHYVCNFQPPDTDFIRQRIDINQNKRFDYLTLACSDASLPGSSLATVDINNDYHGVSEKHAYRRLYDDRADFSFYVNGSSDIKNDGYYVIRFFESWIGYCVNEQYQGDRIAQRNYNYRVYYPDQYSVDELSITKFERDYEGPTLQYNFVKAFPISISSMPVSYESSQLLKCTVSFAYSRYWIQNLINESPTSRPNSNAPGIPELSRFSDSGLESQFNRLTNPLGGQGFGDNLLEQSSRRALTPTDISNININTFQNQ